MSKPDMENFRGALLTLRTRFRGDVSHLADEALGANGAKTGGRSHAPVDMADVATDNFEQEFTLSLMQNQEHVLAEIAEALDAFARARSAGARNARSRSPRHGYRRCPTPVIASRVQGRSNKVPDGGLCQ